MFTEQCFTTPVVTLNYAVGEASGSPLVLLHGVSARWQCALPILPELSQQWQVYAPDLRGHGRSGRVPGSYRLTDYTADIVAFLQQVVKHPAVLFGHSLGGQIALLVAARYPELVRGLIIGDAPFDLVNVQSAFQRNQERLLYWREWAGPGRSTEEIAEALKDTPINVLRFTWSLLLCFFSALTFRLALFYAFDDPTREKSTWNDQKNSIDRIQECDQGGDAETATIALPSW